MADIDIYNVPSLGRPSAQYSHVARVRNARERIYIAGMIAADAGGATVGADDFDTQAAQVFHNIEQALHSANAQWRDVVQFTTYLTRAEDIPRWRAFRDRTFSQWFADGKYPPNTLLVVARLALEAYRIEVQTIAEV